MSVSDKLPCIKIDQQLVAYVFCNVTKDIHNNITLYGKICNFSL